VVFLLYFAFYTAQARQDGHFCSFSPTLHLLSFDTVI
jgi:hypothetical protein